MRYTSIFIVVVLFNLLAYFLIKLRALIYKNDVFKPMLWNIKLSLIPLGILALGSVTTFLFLIITSYNGITFLSYVALASFIITILMWLLFLPNSAYLITELNLTHRSMDKYPVPIWYDIISVLALSLSGIFNTILGITWIQIFYLIYFDPQSISFKNELFMNGSAIFIILLVSIGIYLGREIRFNTWDLLHPFMFIKRLFKHFKKEKELINFLLFVTLHTLFLSLMYVAFAPSFR